MHDALRAQIDEVRGWLSVATRVLVLSGAGASAESGVPTFRGAGGLWRKHDAMSLATPEAFRRDPRGVWAWYRWRQMLVRRCAPNAGHRALVQLEQRCEEFLVATQNVDGLHTEAGSQHVVELHGNLFADRCVECDTTASSWDAAAHFDVDPERPETDPELPVCSWCGGLMRPGVVWFGESLPVEAFHAAERAARTADVLLIVGTSGVVYPAAGLADVAARAGANVAVLNPDASPHESLAHATLRGPSAEILPLLI